MSSSQDMYLGHILCILYLEKNGCLWAYLLARFTCADLKSEQFWNLLVSISFEIIALHNCVYL